MERLLLTDRHFGGSSSSHAGGSCEEEEEEGKVPEAPAAAPHPLRISETTKGGEGDLAGSRVTRSGSGI